MKYSEYGVSQFNDGAVIISCGEKGMETDLVFSSGAMDGDPALAEQLEIAAFIVKACNEYHPLLKVVKALVEKLDADVWFLETAKYEGICVESIKQIVKEAE
jgi:hypothetical protein